MIGPLVAAFFLGRFDYAHAAAATGALVVVCSLAFALSRLRSTAPRQPLMDRTT